MLKYEHICTKLCKTQLKMFKMGIKMFKNERHEQITQLISQKKSMTVGELAGILYVSEATVRRDLKELERAGAVGRSHGGAFLIEGKGADNPGVIREKQNIHKKRQIAEIAKSFITSDSTVFIDSSSSAGQVLALIGNMQGVTVITNGIRNCIKAMENSGARVLLCGGEATSSSDAVIGPEAERFVSDYRADLCIISCGGISADGVTEASPYQAQIKRLMLKGAKKRLLLVDSSKTDKTCMCRMAGFECFDALITDSPLSDELTRAIEKTGCEIIVG